VRHLGKLTPAAVLRLPRMVFGCCASHVSARRRARTIKKLCYRAARRRSFKFVRYSLRFPATHLLFEIFRAKGESLLLIGNAQARAHAEGLFLRSIEISRHQHALSWELCSAVSLARLWRAEHRSRQAKDLLSGVYQRFTEDFATHDLMVAKALLDSLG